MYRGKSLLSQGINNPPIRRAYVVARCHPILPNKKNRETTPEQESQMSFLAGRLAATEGAFFLQESKQAVGRLAQKKKLPTSPTATLLDHRDHGGPSSAAADDILTKQQHGDGADVLPEILRHSVPLRGIIILQEEDSSLSTSKWLLQGSHSSSSVSSSLDALNPLRAYVSLPQATFGPKRWQLPNEDHKVSASTANDLRRDRPANPEKLKAMASGLTLIGKAFAIATAIIFGGAALGVLQLKMHTADDIRTKGRNLVRPGADFVREHLVPIRAWAESMSRKWHLEGDGKSKNKTIVEELSKVYSAKRSD